MKDLGFILMVAGALLTVLIGALFYGYFQQVLAASASAASGSSTSLNNALGIYNGTANMPIFITLAIFGFAFLVLGGVFFVVGNVGELLLDQLEASPNADLERDAPRPSRACTKCGSLLYQSVGFCPNCGSSLTTLPTSAPSPAPVQAKS
jgi:hypothetical protein